MSTETCPRIIESPFRSLARGDSWNAGKPPSTFPNCVSTSSSPISLAGTATEQMLLSSPLDPLVTHAKPSRTVDKHPHALGVGHLAGGVPEVELGQVAAQMLLADRVVRPVQRPLQLGQLLGLVGRHHAPDVFPLGMVDRLVRCHLGTDGRVGGRFVVDILPTAEAGGFLIASGGHANTSSRVVDASSGRCA